MNHSAVLLSILEEHENLLARLETEIERLQTEVSALRNRTTTGPSDDLQSLQLDDLDDSINRLGARIDELESVILQDPAKALGLPLLQRDFEGFKASHQQLAQSLRQEVDRVYDQNKWCIGLMCTMAAGIVGLAYSNLKRPASVKRTTTKRAKRSPKRAAVATTNGSSGLRSELPIRLENRS